MQADQPQQYPGQFYDGQSARNRPARVTLAPHGLAIQVEGETAHRWWPNETLVITHNAASLTFTYGQAGQVAQTLVMESPEFLAAYEQLRPKQTMHTALLVMGGLAVAALVVVVGFFVWGFPWLTGQMAKLLPVSMEERLGRVALESLAPASKRCIDPAVQSIARRLEGTIPESRYTFRVYVVEDPMVNAFAAPGGYIVMHRGLLERTRTPEEAAAVLAHEYQHVLERHSAKGLMRGASIWVTLMLLTGNPGDALFQLAGSLSSLHYQREDEATADRKGLLMLAEAGIDPGAMVRMLETLDELQGDQQPRVTRFLSSHPLTEDRIREVRRMASRMSRGGVRELDVPGSWPPSKARCLAATEEQTH